jgi:hypothetical protein
LKLFNAAAVSGEAAYIRFALKFLELVNRGLIKARVMFTQNIHATDHALSK